MPPVEATRSPQRVSGSQPPEVGGRVGRCAACSAFTYDASGLSEEELRRLVLDTEGRVLTRVVPRTDGRVMTFDCGHGTVDSRRRRSRRWAAAAFVLALVVGGAVAARALAPQPVAPVEPPVVAPIAPETTPEAVVAPEQALAPEPTATPDQPGLEATPPSPPVVDGVRAPPPRVEVHLADVVSSWSTVEDRRVIATPALVAADLEQRLEPLRACYLEVLETDPNYRGTINTTLSVGDTGQVTSVQMPLARNRTGHERLMECCRLALRHESFPWGQGTVSFRLVFAGRL